MGIRLSRDMLCDHVMAGGARPFHADEAYLFDDKTEEISVWIFVSEKTKTGVCFPVFIANQSISKTRSTVHVHFTQMRIQGNVVSTFRNFFAVLPAFQTTVCLCQLFYDLYTPDLLIVMDTRVQDVL